MEKGDGKYTNLVKGKARTLEEKNLSCYMSSIYKIIMHELTSSIETEGKVCEKMIPRFPARVAPVLVQGSYD